MANGRFARFAWYGVMGVGALTFAGAMTRFEKALEVSRYYDRLEADAKRQASAGRMSEPRVQMLTLNVLGSLHDQTHRRLAEGLFGAAGGMSLLVLGQRGARGQRRREEARPLEEVIACSGRDEMSLGGRCAAVAGGRRGSPVGLRVAEPVVDDEEAALLARFEALERQVAASARS